MGGDLGHNLMSDDEGLNADFASAVSRLTLQRLTTAHCGPGHARQAANLERYLSMQPMLVPPAQTDALHCFVYDLFVFRYR